ncbi:MAG: AAA family ATPase [Anaerolineae bacterium]|nr:AAA family ATPase [Anaerolineae bacterium]
MYEDLRAADTPQVAAATDTTPPFPAVNVALPGFLIDDAEQLTAEKLMADSFPFVGRQPELARLNGYLKAALAGRGQVAFVVGGPGRGKTALLRAFAEQAMVAHPDLLAVNGTCAAFSGVGDAYLPFREVLAMLTGDVETQWRAGRITAGHARRLWRALATVLPAVVTHGPSVIGALTLGSELLARASQAGLADAPWMEELTLLCHQRPAGDLVQQALFTQVANTLQAVAGHHPLLLVLDDLHWIDQGSTSLLFLLARGLSGHRILILGAYRPEEVDRLHTLAPVLDELRRRFGDVEIDLRQADETGGAAFVEALVDSEANHLSSGFRTQLHGRTRGHPLFTVELLRDLQLRGDLIRDAAGVWREGSRLDWGALPARVEAVIAARLGRLDPEQRALLEVAAVEGEVFTAQVLAQVLGQEERAVLRRLKQELAAHHRLTRVAEEVIVGGRYLTRYAFTHALYQEHLYEGLSGAERRWLHARVGAALERLYGEERKRVAVRLATHFDLAGEARKAVKYAVGAADQARTIYAYDEATVHYERALALLESVEPDDAAMRQRLAALTGLGKLLLNSGDVPQAETRLREAIALGRRTGQDREDLAILYHWLGEAVTWQGRYEERLRIGQEGRALFDDGAQTLGAALMNQLVAFGVGILGDWDQYDAVTLQTAQFIRELPYAEELMPAYTHIRAMYMWNKDIDASLTWNWAWCDIQFEAGDRTAHRPRGAYGRGDIFGARGDLTESIEVKMPAVAANRRVGDAKHESWCHVDLADLFLATGDLNEATRWADGALALSQSVGYPRDIVFTHCLHGRVALCRGEVQAALDAFLTAEPAYERYFECRGASVSRTSSSGLGCDPAILRRMEIALSYRICENCIPGLVPYLLGQAYLGGHRTDRARAQFERSLRDLAADYGGGDSALLVLPALAGLERSLGSRPAFRRWRGQLLETYPLFARVLQQWWLMAAEIQSALGAPKVDEGFDAVPEAWVWEDPFADCAYALDVQGLEIRAANGRHLLHVNLSAPRLLRPVPANTTDLAVQAVCEPALADRPAIGGLLLWKDKRDYLWLEVGRFGKQDIAFGGCLDNRDLVIGRGRLGEGPDAAWPVGEPIVLRLEVTGNRVAAFCGRDGEQWFTVGHTEFPMDETVRVGVHAIGVIDRSVYHGAFPDGSAIRFSSFKLWAL